MNEKEWVYPESLTKTELMQVVALLLEREGLSIYRQHMTNGKGYDYTELTLENSK